MRRGALLRWLVAAVCAAGCGSQTATSAQNSHFWGPTRLAIQPSSASPDGPLVYVINSFGGDVTVLTSEAYTIIMSAHRPPFSPDTIYVGPAPYDIAITPDGVTVYVTDANPQPVRAMQPLAPFFVVELPLTLNQARVSIAPAAIDPYSFQVTVPPVWTVRREVWFSDPDNSRLVVWDDASSAVAGEVALPSPPVGILVSRDARQVFVTCGDATLRVVDAGTRTLLPPVVNLGGQPDRIAESKDGDFVYVLNINPPQLHVVDAATWIQTDDQITFLSPLNDMALSTDGTLGYITSDDGNLYYFFPSVRRACGSDYDPPSFYDVAPLSNPTLTNIQTADCLTRDEIWTIRYIQVNDIWNVEGSVSGPQANFAKTNQAYISDKQALQFTIRSGAYHESDGDFFQVHTTVIQDPVPVGLLPQGVLASPVRTEPDVGLDWIFVADTGGDIVNRVLTDDTTHHDYAQ